MTASEIQSLVNAHGYKVAVDEQGGLRYKQKPHPRGWVWLLWLATAVLGLAMVIRALVLDINQDLLLASAACVLSIFFAWNNYRQFTAPFRTLILLGSDGITFQDRKQSLYFPQDSIDEFLLLADAGSSALFVKLSDQNIKPMLFRFRGAHEELLKSDLDKVKTYLEQLMHEE